MARYLADGVLGGHVLQSSLPRAGQGAHRAEGLILTGVVVATYVQEDGPNPFVVKNGAETEGGEGSQMVLQEQPLAAVYCDVLIYSTAEAFNGMVLGPAMVAAGSAGMHEGRIWKPRAATIDTSGQPLQIPGSDPRRMDGDHVLVQFIEDNLSKPIITGRIPHPLTGRGNQTVPRAGYRMRLKVQDGSPEYLKHRGTFFGVSDSGDFEIDTTNAHGGKYDEQGVEDRADDGAHGDVLIKVNHKQQLAVQGLDPEQTTAKFSMALKDGLVQLRLDEPKTDLSMTPGEIVVSLKDDGDGILKLNKDVFLAQLNSANRQVKLEATKLTIKLGGTSLTLTLNGSNSILTVGGDPEAGVRVAIGPLLKDLYNSLKAELNTLKSDFNNHKHKATDVSAVIAPSGGGACSGSLEMPATTPPSTATFPPWDPDIESYNLYVPDPNA